MIANHQPYPDYKQSGLPWLTQVPSHWRLLRNGGLFTQRNETGFPALPILEVSIKSGVQVRDLENATRKQFMSDRRKYKRAVVGDIAYNMMRMWQGAAGHVPVDGLVSPAYVVARALPGTDSRYFELLFRTPAYQAEVNSASRGIVSDRNRLYWEDFKQLPSPLPPPDEQLAIVRFLDHANGRIERAIRAKKKLIALLNEQKQAIINYAVTRGLDPNVPLKSSGIPWLGECPEHWKWVAIKRLLSRMDYGTSEVSTETGSIRVLTMGNIQKGEVIMPRSGGLDEVPDSLLLEHLDLLFTRTNGNPDLVGKVGIFRGQFTDRVSFASYLVRLRAKRPHEPQWLHILLNSSAFWPFARSHALVNLQTNLNSTRYGQFPVPVQPPSEQTQIVEWIAEESKTLNTALTRTEREIGLLREYRTRLVADVVTGKLDVRAAAAGLPEEGGKLSEESEQSDGLDESELSGETPLE